MPGPSSPRASPASGRADAWARGTASMRTADRDTAAATPASSRDASLERQSNVVLRQRRGCRPRARDIVELRELELIAECIITFAMQHARHPSRETLDLPNSAQTRLRITIHQCRRSVVEKGRERVGENT